MDYYGRKNAFKTLNKKVDEISQAYNSVSSQRDENLLGDEEDNENKTNIISSVNALSSAANELIALDCYSLPQNFYTQNFMYLSYIDFRYKLTDWTTIPQNTNTYIQDFQKAINLIWDFPSSKNRPSWMYNPPAKVSESNDGCRNSTIFNPCMNPYDLNFKHNEMYYTSQIKNSTDQWGNPVVEETRNWGDNVLYNDSETDYPFGFNGDLNSGYYNAGVKYISQKVPFYDKDAWLKGNQDPQINLVILKEAINSFITEYFNTNKTIKTGVGINYANQNYLGTSVTISNFKPLFYIWGDGFTNSNQLYFSQNSSVSEPTISRTNFNDLLNKWRISVSNSNINKGNLSKLVRIDKSYQNTSYYPNYSTYWNMSLGIRSATTSSTQNNIVGSDFLFASNNYNTNTLISIAIGLRDSFLLILGRILGAINSVPTENYLSPYSLKEDCVSLNVEINSLTFNATNLYDNLIYLRDKINSLQQKSVPRANFLFSSLTSDDLIKPFYDGVLNRFNKMDGTFFNWMKNVLNTDSLYLKYKKKYNDCKKFFLICAYWKVIDQPTDEYFCVVEENCYGKQYYDSIPSLKPKDKIFIFDDEMYETECFINSIVIEKRTGADSNGDSILVNVIKINTSKIIPSYYDAEKNLIVMKEF